MPYAIPQTHSTFYPHRLIDLIYTNYPDKVDYSGVCNVSISDHSLVFAYRSCRLPGTVSKRHNTINYRSFKDFNPDHFCSELKNGMSETILKTQMTCGVSGKLSS